MIPIRHSNKLYGLDRDNLDYLRENTFNEEPSKTITRETIHNIYKSYINSFNINSIPVNIRKTYYKDFGDIFDFVNGECSESTVEDYFSQLFESIEEQNIESVRTVIQRLVSVYDYSETLFKAFSPYKVRIVEIKKIPLYAEVTNSAIIPNLGSNVEIIEKEMLAGGYYKSYEKDFEDGEGMKWAHLIFDPIRQDTVTKQIRDNCSVLYHYSPICNAQSIQEYGIIAQNQGRRFKYYTDRVYMFPEKKDGINISHLKMMKNITSNRKRTEGDFNGKYNRYVIRVDCIPENIEFFDDPHGFGCVYTTSSIPVNSIMFPPTRCNF